MSAISIVHSKAGSTEVVEPGTHLSLQPGDKIVIEAESKDMTSAIKAESSLVFTIHQNLNLTIDNFFSDKNNQLVFNDRTFSPDELIKNLTISLKLTHDDGIIRELWVAPYSTIPTHSGDRFEFLNSEVAFSDVHRKGNDLLVYFGPESIAAGKHIVLSKFYAHPHSGLSDPLVMLTDKENKATDIIVHSEHNEELQWHGVPITSATPGVPYGYYFYLTGENLESIEVDIEALEGTLPTWLTLMPLGHGEFILSGTPPRDFSGQLKLEIRAHETRNGVRVHTQQAFELTAIGAARRSTERALATSVIAAELRGASSTSTASQSVLTGSNSLAGAMSSSAVVIASASSLSSVNAVVAKPILFSTFENLSVSPLGITALNVSRTSVQAPVTTSQSTERGNININTAPGTVLVLQNAEQHVSKSESEVLATPLSAVVATFIPPAPGPSLQLLSTLSRAQLAGEFRAIPDVYTVAQTVNTFLPPLGVLGNDSDTILSGQFIRVTSINGVRVPAGGSVSVTLQSGAVVTMSSDGSFTFDPSNMFIPLYQTNIEPVLFTYTTTNGLVSSTSVVTLNVLGINDTPVIADNQVFSVPQYSPVGSAIVAGTVVASEPDNGDVLTYSIVGGTGLGVFVIDPSTGLITVSNPAALTIIPPLYTLTIQVEDSHAGVFGYLPFIVTNDVTIKITHVTPQITNSPLSFHMNENSVSGAFVGHVSATNYIINNVVINPDSGFFNYTLSGSNVGQFSIDSSGNISVAAGATLPFNFQLTPTLTVNATVTDVYYNGVIAQPNLTTTQPFTIYVDGIAITNSPLSFNVNMDTVAGTSVKQVNYVTTDPNPSPLFTITGGTGSALFNIDPVTGIISVANGATFDFRVTPSYTLNVHVSDNYSAVSTPLTDSAIFTVNITGVAISNTSTIFTVLDGSGPNTDVGDVNVVSNPSSSLGISYSITGGNSAGDFKINSSTGLIEVNNGHNINYETTPTYSLTVTVVDANPALPTAMITSQVFTINVQGIDIIDPHVFTVPNGTVGGSTVGQVLVTSSDPNYAVNTVYTITGGNGASVFDINPSTGVITVEPDNTINYASQSSYTLNIRVVDTYNSIVVSDNETVTINVTPPPAPLMALNGENTTDPVSTILSASTLSFISTVAIQNWGLTNLSPSQVEALNHLEFTVGDLPNGMLGQQIGNHIIIDSNAAGYGWYLDGYPLDHSAFSINLIDGNAFMATPQSEAYSHVDLMTVVLHEIGHAIGEADVPYDSTQPQLMADQLATGTRILPPGVVVSDQGVNFDNLQHTTREGGADHHDLSMLNGPQIFSDNNALNLNAVGSVFNHSPELGSKEMNHSMNHEMNPIHSNLHDVSHLANDIWYSSVDGSHAQYTHASGSIVGMEHHVPVLF